MSKKFSKIKFFGFVLTLLSLLLAMLLTACNDNYDDKVFSSDGIVFTLDESLGCYEVTGYDGNANNVVIPSKYKSRNVAKIANKAFLGCSGIVEIKIEDGVKEIGSNSFEKCSGLTNITIPNSVTTIGISAFSECSGLTRVTIPNSITTISSKTFSRCTGLTDISIPNSVASIHSKAFSYCEKLSSITMPDRTITISEDAFVGTAWYNNQPNGLVYIGKMAYTYKGEMADDTSIIIKEGTLGIAYRAFQGCANLISVTIPDSVTNIGSYAFAGCTKLANVIIGNGVSSIGDDAFFECIGLANIAFGKGVSIIGNSAFRGCSNLTSITIPESVSVIFERAFYECVGLTNIELPKNLKRIGCAAFGKCRGLTEVNWTPIDCTGVKDESQYFQNSPIFDECPNLAMIYISKETKRIPKYLNSLGEEYSSTTKRADVAFDGTIAEWENLAKYINSSSKVTCIDGIY